MDTTCTKKKPYFQVDGNLEDDEYCEGPLYLGLAHEVHYQSLVEVDDMEKDDEMIEEDTANDVEEGKEDNEKKRKEEKKAELNCETLDYWKANEQPSWTTERDLAGAIMESLRRNGVQDVFKLDKLTKGEGNGFMIATMQQLRRHDVIEASRQEVKDIAASMNHSLLRTSVYKWVMQHLNHPKIIRMRELYELDQAIKKELGEETKVWDDYWNHMLKDGIWADNWFVHATAMFLEMDLWTCGGSNRSQDI